jgi:hypothetical protein
VPPPSYRALPGAGRVSLIAAKLSVPRGISRAALVRVALAGSFAFSVNPALYPKLSFDYAKDFQPVFLAFVAAETEKWGRVAREAGIKIGEQDACPGRAAQHDPGRAKREPGEVVADPGPRLSDS